MEGEIINKVAQSKIFTLDMEEILPKKSEILIFDLKDYLFQEMVLREKDFRQALKEKDWQFYKNKYVIVTCTADAIVPIWAYMLVATYLQEVDAQFATGEEALMINVLNFEVNKILDDLDDRPVVIKGCSGIDFKETLYLECTKLLSNKVKSIMYGEPCSTVPIMKRK